MAYKFLTTITVFVTVMIFAVQNAAVVEIQLLFRELAFPRALLIFMMLLTGILIGWSVRSIFRIARDIE